MISPKSSHCNFPKDGDANKAVDPGARLTKHRA